MPSSSQQRGEVSALLKMMHIEKSFNIGTINEKKVLNDLNLTINDGDFITVIGGNGAGKSTMLNTIAGVYRVDGGRILLDGEDITYKSETDRARYIGRVFQDPMMGTAANMQIEENLAIASRRGRVPTLRWSSPASQREKFREQLKTLNLGLEDRLESKVGLLSGGQRQALTLLMATLVEPKLLLLDEHTAALDPKTAAQVLALTNDIVNKRKLTTLMITHNMKDALACGNRLIMLHNGHILIDVKGEEKKNLTIKDLLAMFEKAAGSEMNSDALLLS